MTKSDTIDEDGWKKAVSYSVVCLSCYKSYEKDGLILHTEEEAMRWLHEKENTVSD
jgi:hypothetical protein